MYEVYAGLLKMMDKFQKSNTPCSITYELDADYSELKEKYPLEQVAGGGTDEERSFRLLSWIAEHIKHKGDYDGHVQNTALALFEYAFDTENGINCASLSMALTECLLAVGIKARAVFIHPFSPYDCDNHVVCEAWSKERKKWMMLDPTYGSGAFYEEVPLSIAEIRKLLAERKEIVFSETIHYNGEPVTDLQDVREYYAKDLFWMMLTSIQGSQKDFSKMGLAYYFAPEGFDVKKHMLANIQYREELWGKQEWLEQRKKMLAVDAEFIYQDLEALYDN